MCTSGSYQPECWAPEGGSLDPGAGGREAGNRGPAAGHSAAEPGSGAAGAAAGWGGGLLKHCQKAWCLYWAPEQPEGHNAFSLAPKVTETKEISAYYYDTWWCFCLNYMQDLDEYSVLRITIWPNCRKYHRLKNESAHHNNIYLSYRNVLPNITLKLYYIKPILHSKNKVLPKKSTEKEQIFLNKSKTSCRRLF